MKKIPIILTLCFLISSTGCEKYVTQDDIDPNNPVDVPVNTVLSAAQVAMFSTFNGQMNRNAGMWSQHFEGCLFQMVEQGEYSLSEVDVTNDWTTLYAAGVVNCLTVITKGNEGNAPYYVGIGKVCEAMCLGLASDFWGDVPGAEAGLGLSGNYYPAYQTQQDLLIYVQQLLSEGITELQKDPSTVNPNLLPGADDLIHNGDVNAWIKTAWILKARYANRKSNRDPANSALEALAFIDSAGLTGNSDDAECHFGTQGGTALNPWYAFNTDRTDYIKVSAVLLDTMTNLGDPRLEFYAATYINSDTLIGDTISGAPLGSNSTEASYIDSFYALPESPLPLVTYVEAKFIEAEAALRAGDNARAQLAFTDALAASFDRFLNAEDVPANYDSVVTVYKAANGTLNPGTEFQQIMFQKWISNFAQCEVWADWRRTDLPVLTPNPNGIIPTIPIRYPTEQNERTLNPHAVVVSNLEDHVWWDF